MDRLFFSYIDLELAQMIEAHGQDIFTAHGQNIFTGHKQPLF